MNAAHVNRVFAFPPKVSISRRLPSSPFLAELGGALSPQWAEIANS